MSKPSFDENLQTIDTDTLDSITGGESGANYQCGPYRLDLIGADRASVSRNGKLLAQYDSEAATPTFMKKGQTYLARNNKAYRCRFLNGN